MKYTGILMTLFALLGACKSLPVRKNPAITYVAGPNQLTLLLDESTFRFAYDTDNQFRAERRYPNGTVAGYFGFVGADGKAVRVKYGAVDELGFSAVQELIPDAFPETVTVPDETATAEAALATTPEAASDDDAKINLLPEPYEPIVDDVNDSISVDAIEFYEARTKVETPTADRWRFPLIEAEEIPIKTRKSRAIQNQKETFRRLFRQGLVLEQHPGEPAIIYADPEATVSNDRYVKTAHAQITLA